MIVKTRKFTKIIVNLDGPDGNAYVLLGMASNWAKQIGLDWDAIRTEATSSDYKKLILTLDKYFGKVVEFQTEQTDLLEMDEISVEIEARMRNMFGSDYDQKSPDEVAKRREAKKERILRRNDNSLTYVH